MPLTIFTMFSIKRPAGQPTATAPPQKLLSLTAKAADYKFPQLGMLYFVLFEI